MFLWPHTSTWNFRERRDLPLTLATIAAARVALWGEQAR